ncbi:hypothetical protein [Streptomyces sp. NPDC051561]|uniref:hypothetical protein n=1 Tax=Streptomyces sp. NPDC051561 TaxID=3365658 RepID=UPI00378DC320
MIRLVSSSRLAGLAAEADDARAVVRQVLERETASYREHLRAVYALVARAESAEAEAVLLRDDNVLLLRDTAHLAQELEETQEELAAKPVSPRPSLDRPALLLYRGQPHSIHADADAARAHADSLGAFENRWITTRELGSAAALWEIQTFIRADDGRHFTSTVAPVVRPLEGAG